MTVTALSACHVRGRTESHLQAASLPQCARLPDCQVQSSVLALAQAMCPEGRDAMLKGQVLHMHRCSGMAALSGWQLCMAAAESVQLLPRAPGHVHALKPSDVSQSFTYRRKGATIDCTRMKGSREGC